MTKVAVFGAGMAGLLAANMLRDRLHFVYESQQTLPNNHSAVLRFKTSIISDTLNIPFRQVKMMKAVLPWKNPIADALAYSRKTNGVASLRSSIGANGEVYDRYISPDNLIELMAQPLLREEQIGLNSPIEFGDISEFQKAGEKIISTLPMPKLMAILEYPHRDRVQFRSVPGWNVIAELDKVDAYLSMYLPNPSLLGSRISITGRQLVVECHEPVVGYETDVVIQAMECLGLPANMASLPIVKPQLYSKILPIDNDERKRFIIWASDTFGIYSFGRYATWRPGLLLDDLVQDFRIIMRLIDGASRYDHVK